MPSKLFILTIIFFQSILFAQVDSSFLSSLPEGIRDDFMNQSEKKNKENIVNPDTRLFKLEEALKDAESSLKKIKAEMSNNDLASGDDDLARFGDNFFSTYQSTFLPINEPNLSSNYILDVGDVISFQVIGQSSSAKNITIGRDGALNIPGVGKITVAGLSLDTAAKVVNSKLSEALIGKEAIISLKEVRDINVLVVGNVSMPGMYTLAGGSSPLSLINAAGGILKNGSYRKISHMRDDKLLQNLDLYKILVEGKYGFSHNLRSGDVIVIHPKLEEVKVSGSFANVGIFELTSSDNLESLISYAGIITRGSNNYFSIERYQSGISEEIKLTLEDSLDIDLKAGDSIKFYSTEPNFMGAIEVSISGALKVPGKYIFPHGISLSDAIIAAGGYSDLAYPLGGRYFSKKAKVAEINYKDRSYNELISFLVASPNFSKTVSPEGIIPFLQLLKDYQPTGRLTTEFNLNKLSEDPTLDKRLEDGDTIEIPYLSRSIFIFGEIMGPGGYAYSPELSVKDYILLAGDFSQIADEDRVILVHPNGVSERITMSFLRSSESDLLPGSVIYVPRKVGKLDGINFASVVAPIVSSIALSLASLNSIN